MSNSVPTRTSFGKGHRPWNAGLRYRSGQIAWNKGLTKYTDSRVKKISKALAGVPKLWTRQPGFVGVNKGRKWSDEYKKKMSRAVKLARKIHPVWNKGLTKKDHPSLDSMARNLSLAIKGVPRPFVSSKQGRRRFWYYGKRRIRMRSRWEVAYSHWLDSEKVAWLYESTTFVTNKFSYTPDFYLPATKTFVEVKGWKNGDYELKIQALRTRWGVKLLVLQQEDLQKLQILDEQGRVAAIERRFS